ncbi:SDR family oxidoreductase [Frankia sp. CNm7]|uniref:SDR family oxidoreductase n=1 Tax=Frankia nepalensis TaxID=1836974 RepID=A0A937RKQ2_9ACTN|nr:SDR family oxidoreductase [Frankia nepalensis]MBL7500792.1 SDR family oxidoreductase [Frankia nepalensis]MBL7512599.1 SDR family oxidoreductase [Frankia nepalensis]MBL7523039.1 SDR family oxidoreductase [Frankia nepalensis]MBL7628208.1 SDR family oxidoreductase [Frankia nepalensis]
MLLRNKTTLITGVGSGLGREMASSMLAAGANVVIAARSADGLRQAAKELDPSGERVLAHPADICDEESCEALVTAAVDRFGAVDSVVQVAAFEDAFGGLFDADLDKWSRAFDTNVLGSLRLLRAVVPAMKERGGGSVVLVGSQSAFKVAMPQGGYAASKGALLSAMYYLADELGPDGIRVNTVVPSWMWGPNVQLYVDFRAQTEGKSTDEILEEIVGKFPLRRMTEDSEVADAAVFFCSDLSRAVTGQYLLVNSGELMR